MPPKEHIFIRTSTARNAGFTLIELSIVLIIIGLLIGGVLVGRTLIKAAEVRAQVSQFEKFDTAVKTFRLKYDGMPGDLLPATATQLGFSSHVSFGNNNQMLDDANGAMPILIAWGEPYFFFIQLSQANLIEGTFTMVANTYIIGNQFPPGKLGGGTIPFSLSNGRLAYFYGMNHDTTTNQYNLFEMSTAGIITASDAYGIDSKIDDGLPMSGMVRPATAPTAYDTTSNLCITSAAGNQYNLSDTNLNCRLIVVAR